jgi:hypothetical protein
MRPTKKDLLEQIEGLSDFECSVLSTVLTEYKSAYEHYPEWPLDVIHKAAIVAEEAGELIRATLLYMYEDGKYYDMHKEATQTSAMGFRFLVEMFDEDRHGPWMDGKFQFTEKRKGDSDGK